MSPTSPSRSAHGSGWRSSNVEQVRRAAELHDVGKMAIPDAILLKTGPLDDDEWVFVRRHTLTGEWILSAAPALANVARLVRSSHERWDGTGYPDGLAGEEIPLESRIVTVADAYAAMVSDRPYRAALRMWRRSASCGERRHAVRPAGRRRRGRGAPGAGAPRRKRRRRVGRPLATTRPGTLARRLS